MRKTMKMWRWFPQQRQSFLANQVVLSGRRKAQGIASSGRTKSLRPSLNLWWCWTWGEEKMMVRPKHLHLVSWFTRKVPHQNVSHPFSNPFNSICTLQVKISLYIGYLVFSLWYCHFGPTKSTILLWSLDPSRPKTEESFFSCSAQVPVLLLADWSGIWSSSSPSGYVSNPTEMN